MDCLDFINSCYMRFGIFDKFRINGFQLTVNSFIENFPLKTRKINLIWKIFHIYLCARLCYNRKKEKDSMHMIIDWKKLNPLEQSIYKQLVLYAGENTSIKISEAALYCGCSVSKISKFVKKLGFDNFKQFAAFLQGKEPEKKSCSSELERIRQFTEEFDFRIVENFIEQLEKHKKIIILGYGPSYYCAQYFEYKLRLQSEAFIIAVPDLVTAKELMDSTTLLVVFSATGHFTSFQEICEEAKIKGCDTLMIVEEYHVDLLEQYENVCFLTHSAQPSELKPYEKSRTVFFIFIEEVIFRILERKGKIWRH